MVITRWIISIATQSVDQHFYQHGVLKTDQRVRFDEEYIRLDVPSDEIAKEEWKVVPCTSPSVVSRM